MGSRSFDSFDKIRKEYNIGFLEIANTPEDPLSLFDLWLNDAQKCGVIEPNAMALSTVDCGGKPHCRMVLLKKFGPDGFCFFTNYESNKAKQISDNLNVALTFYWMQLERQVRIEGTISKTNNEISDQYFNSRPIQSRLSAIISPQSKRIIDEEQFKNDREAKIASYNNKEVARPEYWGGYIVSPTSIEFWQGRPNRFHDRVLYERSCDNWQKSRLAP